MLHTAKTLRAFSVDATDGRLGSVTDVLFDDAAWVVRYLVVDTGKWLRRRELLISPHSVRTVDEPAEQVALSLTRARIEESPPLEAHPPVSRRREAAYFDYFGYPYYWGSTGSIGVSPPPVITSEHQAALDDRVSAEQAEAAERGDEHLRSAVEVAGYSVAATDGELGHVHDLLIRDATWIIDYLVVDTKNWWADNLVVIPPDWISDVAWARRQITVSVAREAIRSSPRYLGRVDLERRFR